MVFLAFEDFRRDKHGEVGILDAEVFNFGIEPFCMGWLTVSREERRDERTLDLFPDTV